MNEHGNNIDYSPLREGLCPVHRSTLERRDGHGWCDECGMGWSMTPDSVTVHFDVSGFDIDGLGVIRSASAKFTKPIR